MVNIGRAAQQQPEPDELGEGRAQHAPDLRLEKAAGNVQFSLTPFGQQTVEHGHQNALVGGIVDVVWGMIHRHGYSVASIVSTSASAGRDCLLLSSRC